MLHIRAFHIHFQAKHFGRCDDFVTARYGVVRHRGDGIVLLLLHVLFSAAKGLECDSLVAGFVLDAFLLPFFITVIGATLVF